MMWHHVKLDKNTRRRGYQATRQRIFCPTLH